MISSKVLGEVLKVFGGFELVFGYWRPRPVLVFAFGVLFLLVRSVHVSHSHRKEMTTSTAFCELELGSSTESRAISSNGRGIGGIVSICFRARISAIFRPGRIDRRG
jgi:hypothetical protein